jgi:hypothetical protein
MNTRDHPYRVIPGNGPATGPSADRPASAMRLLACGVPLSLIMDLATPGGPRSREILTVEGHPENPQWDPH